MEKIMSKSNDTTKTRELTEAELAAVSGGYTLENTMISGYAVVGGGIGGGGTGTGSGFTGWNIRQNKA
jgi:bacteriocin-like protein